MSDPRKLHAAVLGENSIRASGFVRTGVDDAKAVDSLYELWVHRCVGINASVLASIGYKLVSLTEGPAARAAMMNSGLARPLGRETRAMMQGRAELLPPSTVTKATRYRLDDAVEVEDHPVLDLLAKANSWTDGYSLTEGIGGDLQLFGEAYLFVATDQSTRIPIELWRMLAPYVSPIPDPAEFVRGFRYKHGATDEVFGTDEVVWIRRYSPLNPYKGRGELDAFADYARASSHIAEFNKWLFERHGAPDYVVTTDKPQSESDKRAFRKRWSQLFGRLFRRAETVAFLTGDAKLERLTQSNRELEFSESSRLVRDFIAAGFGVPKALLTPEDANRAVTREAIDQHLRLTVWPLACRVYDALNEQLLPLFGGTMLLVPDNPIRTDAATRAQERASHLASGWSVNEVRRDDGAPSIDDPSADLPMVGAGFRPLDQVVNPPSPFGGFGFGGDPEGEEPEGEPEGGEEPEEDEEAPPAGGDAEAAQRGILIRCGCSDVVLRPGATRITQAALILGGFGLGVEKVAPLAPGFGDEAEAAMILRALVITLRGMRRALDDLSAVSLDPDDPFGDDVLAAAYREAREAIASPLTLIVSSTAEATIRRVTPGSARIGIRFNATNPRVSDFIERSADRIARTVVGAMNDRTKSLIAQGIRDGRNPVEVARAIAMTEDVTDAMARRIARTEYVFAQTQGLCEGWEASPVVRGKRFNLSANPCPLCVAADRDAQSRRPDGVFDPMEPVFPSGTAVQPADGSKTVVLDYLPGGLLGGGIHPNCRCSVSEVLIDE